MTGLGSGWAGGKAGGWFGSFFGPWGPPIGFVIGFGGGAWLNIRVNNYIDPILEDVFRNKRLIHSVNPSAVYEIEKNRRFTLR